MFWDIPLQDSCNRISRDIPLWYIPVLLGTNDKWNKKGYPCADLQVRISRDIPVSAFLERDNPNL